MKGTKQFPQVSTLISAIPLVQISCFTYQPCVLCPAVRIFKHLRPGLRCSSSFSISSKAILRQLDFKQIFNVLGTPFESVNILEDESLRQGMKEFSQASAAKFTSACGHHQDP